MEESIGEIKKRKPCRLCKKDRVFMWCGIFPCDLTGARTQDPLLKREMLYQLSYQVLLKIATKVLR